MESAGGRVIYATSIELDGSLPALLSSAFPSLRNAKDLLQLSPFPVGNLEENTLF